MRTEDPDLARLAALGASYRQLDYWSRRGLVDDTSRDVGGGFVGRWAKTRDQRIRALLLVSAVSSRSYNLGLVNGLDATGVAVIEVPGIGTVTFRFNDEHSTNNNKEQP